jgi:hypothetical protein
LIVVNLLPILPRTPFMASLRGQSAPGPIYCKMDSGRSQVVMPVSQALGCGTSSFTLLPVCLISHIFGLCLPVEMRVNNRRGYTWKAWVLLAPFTCGILVPVSRSMDYRHHATDLIAGSLIGILTAWVGYRSYYPVSYILRSEVQVQS